MISLCVWRKVLMSKEFPCTLHTGKCSYTIYLVYYTTFIVLYLPYILLLITTLRVAPKSAYADDSPRGRFSAHFFHFASGNPLGNSGQVIFRLWRVLRFFPNCKLQNAKILTVTLPKTEQIPEFRNVKCSTDQMFGKSLYRASFVWQTKCSTNQNFEFWVILLSSQNFEFWVILSSSQNFEFWVILLSSQNFEFWVILLSSQNFEFWILSYFIVIGPHLT
jgi:hypothetical protein